jgi:hypothetical protein
MSGGVFGRGDPAEGLPRVSPYFGSTNSGAISIHLICFIRIGKPITGWAYDITRLARFLHLGWQQNLLVARITPCYTNCHVPLDVNPFKTLSHPKHAGRTASEFRRGFLKKRRVSSGVKVRSLCSYCV